jgi:hypothetical protein
MTQMHNISVSALNSARDIIFLNSGQTMVVASSSNNRLLFFNRSSAVSYNYNLIGSQNVSCVYPHGLTYVNDTFFYLISWGNNNVYSYSNWGNSSAWTETLALNLWSTTGSSDGNHVSVDECGRLWVSLGQYGVRIYDSQGVLRGTLKPLGLAVSDTLILPNYVVYMSGYYSNDVLRIDPSIQC